MRFILILFSFNFFSVKGQDLKKDTMRLTVPEAEKIFFENNFQLLAQKYNVDAQKALIVQARLWPNPNFSYGRGPVIPIYDPNSQFPHSNFFLNSENSFTLSQLVQLAGKRNKQIKIAEANTSLAQFQFFDLIRTLKYSLRSNFFNIYYLQRSAKVYDAEIKALQQIVSAFERQQDKGYIAEKEVIRIKAQLYSFTSEYSALQVQISGLESQLRLLLQAKPEIHIDPLVDQQSVEALDPSRYSISTLIDSALQNRTDLNIARINTTINLLNYNYQKALAVPDLGTSFSYDKQGSYALNFTSLGVSFDLPLFNRNQGNIRSAKAQIENSKALQKSAEALVQENISQSLEVAFTQNKLYRSLDTHFMGDFERLKNEVIDNYQKRNIGLLDFLDFYDSYKQNALQINTIEYNRVQSFEDLNFYTATNFF